MKQNNTSRNALVTSIISLLLCVSLLVGATFAWFTDSVVSGKNVIAAGNLDVELEYWDGGKYIPVNAQTNVFKQDTLWEPGHTEVVHLRIRNAGTLALKYNLGVNVASEVAGTNVYGKVFNLSDYIEFGAIRTDAIYADRDAARIAVAESAPLAAGYTTNGLLYAANSTAGVSEELVALVVYMPESVDNNANYKTGTTPPKINLGLKLFATQLEHESDSFGSDYDKNSGWVGEVDAAWYNPQKSSFTLTTAKQLAGLAKLVNAGTSFANKSIYLGADIDLNNTAWTPIGNADNGFGGKFIGNGYTISNLNVIGTEGVGLFGFVGNAAHIEGVKIVNAMVTGTHWVGAVMGYGYLAKDCLVDCYVENAVITCNPVQKADGSYDDGNQVGAIAGMAINGNITGNTAVNCTIYGYRDIGGIVGCAQAENRDITVENNTIENVTIVKLGALGKYDPKAENIGDVVGRKTGGKTVTVGTNTGTATIPADSGATVINNIQELFAFAQAVNNGVNFAGKKVLLNADIDLNGAEWTPIGNSTNKFQGIFDGQGHTIKNLVVNMPGKSNVGLFGHTTNGEIKNLTVENAKVTGRLNVGVVAGTPYTSKYSNIMVKGHVEVNGMAYVGGVAGKNAYANWDNIIVNVDETSFVMANSVENGTAYRTYVGGVIGFMGEGSHRVTNITSNIDVFGSTCDVGGIVGIAHYGNSFENVTCTGDVTITDATEADEVEEMGGIAGVWNNNQSSVTFTGCRFEGKLSANFVEGVDLSDNTITGKRYNENGDGKLYIDGKCVWPEIDQWDGKSDTTWYNEAETEFILDSSAKFAGLAELVDGGNTFEGKTIMLDTDLDLYCEGENGEPICFNPVGSYRNDTAFKGTFDGQGHTIKNMNQNTWALDNGYYYSDCGLGLFGAVEDAYIKNVNFDGANVSGESALCGTVAAVAHNSTFENITVSNSNVADYQYYAGGIVGWASGKMQFINCDIDASTNIAAQWGDFDNSIGGVIGGASSSAEILLKDCTVACRIDAYNDVTSSYQWYAYRRAGMLIGNSGVTAKDGDRTVAAAPQLTCENVTVIYGDWANYTYCEFAGTSWPYVRVQAGVSNSAYSNPRYGHPTDANGNQVIDDNHAHNAGEDHFIDCTFDQLYGGGQGVYGYPTHDGVTVVYNNK